MLVSGCGPDCPCLLNGECECEEEMENHEKAKII